MEAERSRLARARAALDRSEAWRREDAARRQADAVRLRLEAEAAKAAAAEHVAEAAALEAQDGEGSTRRRPRPRPRWRPRSTPAAHTPRPRARRPTSAASAKAAVARSAELGERLGRWAASKDASARLRHHPGRRVGAAQPAQAKASTGGPPPKPRPLRPRQTPPGPAKPPARPGCGPRDWRRTASRDRARLESLELALRRGDGLSPAAQALRDSGARLVLAGIEAEPQEYERAVAAALGWRAGAVVAERLDQALDLLEQGDGELNVVTAGGDGRAAGEMPAGARPLAEVVPRIIDRSLAPLVAGIWLVDDLRGVQSGVAVTAEAVGLDADRRRGLAVADAGEASWLGARRARLAGRRPGGAGAGGGACPRRAAETAGTAAATAATADAAARDRLRDARRRRAGGGRRAAACVRCPRRPADELARRDPGAIGRSRSGVRERQADRAARAAGRVRGVAGGAAVGGAGRRRAACRSGDDPPTAGRRGGFARRPAGRRSTSGSSASAMKRWRPRGSRAGGGGGAALAASLRPGGRGRARRRPAGRRARRGAGCRERAGRAGQGRH